MSKKLDQIEACQLHNDFERCMFCAELSEKGSEKSHLYRTVMGDFFNAAANELKKEIIKRRIILRPDSRAFKIYERPGEKTWDGYMHSRKNRDEVNELFRIYYSICPKIQDKAI
ncbi:MAG: hypothetical protein FWG80_01805 [Alphaproteobacteria bacterium]|nr:hypothetical protein [Alphaproteobacteria bacterium]